MSYMDDKNILKEGFFDFLKKIPKKYQNLSAREKRMYKKDPEFKKIVDDFYERKAKLDKAIKGFQ